MAHKMKRRFQGGKIENKDEAPSKEVKPYDAQGSKDEEEAEEKKRGGRVKKKDGGKVEGEKARHRMDRRACGGAMRKERKRGGRVGSDMNPMSSATMKPAMDHKTDS